MSLKPLKVLPSAMDASTCACCPKVRGKAKIVGSPRRIVVR